MNNIQDLELLKVYKERLFLPHDKMNKYAQSCIFMQGGNLESIAKIFNNDHPKLTNLGNIYKLYFYDAMRLRYVVKSPLVKNSGKTNVEARNERLAVYQHMEELAPQVLTPLVITNNKGLNMLYDLNPTVDIIKTHPKLQVTNTINKIKAFMNTIYAELNEINISGKDGKYTKYFLVDIEKDKGILGEEFLSTFLYTLKNQNRFTQDGEFMFGKDINILVFSNKGYFVLNPSKLDKGDYTRLLTLVKRVSNVNVEKILDTDLEKKAQISNNLIKYGFTGEVDDEVIDKISDKIDDSIDDGDVSDEEIEKLINSDDEIKKELANNIVKTPVNAVSKRDAILREKQASVKIGNKTLGELLETKKSIDNSAPILETKVTTMKSTNENMKSVKFHNFEKSYMENTYEKDIAAMFASFNNKSIDMNIISVDIEDTSDPLTIKETYRVVYEDERRVRHTIKVALPKYIDDKFLYVNGNKKVINKQLAPLPIIKTGPDEVQICSNYNKIFIRRFGNKINPDTERFKKLLSDEEIKEIKVVRGNSTRANKPYLTNLEFDELAKDYYKITTSKATFLFNAEEIYNKFNGKEASTDEKLLIGFTNDNKPIYHDIKDTEHPTIISKIVEYSKPETQEKFDSYTFGKKYIHTKATIMAKNIPLVILICYFEGLSTVIRKLNCSDVSYSDKKDKGPGYTYIKFADGYLCYPYSNMEVCLLLNGLSEIKTQAYTFEEMDQRETYLDIFQSLVGTAYIAGALINYYDFMLCPISIGILERMNLPTDIVSLMIYANRLLADNDFTDDIDLKLYRLRSNEVVAGILYKQLTIAYQKYRQTANNPNPVKMSMDENAVIKELMALPTVEDYSTLNPIVEISKLHLASTKGYVGMNLDRAYTEQKRSYHDSMLGVIGISTDTGPNCGKVRHLTTEPTIMDTRGFLDTNNIGKLDNMTDTNLFTPAEEITTLGIRHDNAIRSAMATKQSSHMVAVKSPCPVLISTGMEESIHYRTTNDFSVIAKDNGQVVNIDEKLGIMVVKYNSGEHQFIDISNRVAKNGGGGFYIINKLTPRFKLNDKFKKDEILAFDANYYKDDKYFGNRLCLGALLKVAIMSNYATYEDSSFITAHMSDELASEFTMDKHVVIGKNATVDYIVKVGQKVTIGDELIRFESSYDDSELNKLLANVRDDLKEEIVAQGKTKIKSKYDGEIVDVKIMTTVDLEELSPSLRKIVKDYQNHQKDRRKLLDKYDKSTSNSVYRNGILLDAPEEKVQSQYGKVKGIEVGEGVLVEFKIKYIDRLGVGDKVTMFTANKNTVGYVVPKGFEPYTEFRPYEEISTPLAPSAILQRGTPSVVTTTLGNKVLVELKRRFFETMTGMDYNDFMKEELENQLKNTTVKESMSNNDYDEIRDMLESVFKLDIVEEMYASTRYYSEGDIIASDLNETYTTEHLTEFVESSQFNNAVMLEDGTVVATTDIKPGDVFVLKEA